MSDPVPPTEAQSSYLDEFELPIVERVHTYRQDVLNKIKANGLHKNDLALNEDQMNIINSFTDEEVKVMPVDTRQSLIDLIEGCDTKPSEDAQARMHSFADCGQTEAVKEVSVVRAYPPVPDRMFLGSTLRDLHASMVSHRGQTVAEEDQVDALRMIHTVRDSIRDANQRLLFFEQEIDEKEHTIRELEEQNGRLLAIETSRALLSQTNLDDESGIARSRAALLAFSDAQNLVDRRHKLDDPTPIDHLVDLFHLAKSMPGHVQSCYQTALRSVCLLLGVRFETLEGASKQLQPTPLEREAVEKAEAAANSLSDEPSADDPMPNADPILRAYLLGKLNRSDAAVALSAVVRRQLAPTKDPARFARTRAVYDLIDRAAKSRASDSNRVVDPLSAAEVKKALSHRET